MKRAGLLIEVLALLLVMLATVLLGSPYAPPVGPVREIEEIWDIEDAREMSDAPLVTALQFDGMPLAYDAGTDTFYCTLGLEQGEAWPALHLTAPEAKGVSLCFTDDYAYDSCAEAIREGYAYEVMAYTDSAYDYFSIVFTGLPVVTIDTQTEITDSETDASVTFCGYGEAPVVSPARVHLRGAGSRVSDKKSYHVDFVRGSGRGRAEVQMPLLGLDDELLLIAGVMDDTLMRDRLSWDMYATIADPGESYGPRRMEYCEVFVNGGYAGVYLMMRPVDDGEELAKSGAELPGLDSVYRSTQTAYGQERPYVDSMVREGSGYELRHGSAQADVFAALSDYLALEVMQDDETFCERAMACIDPSIVRYYLFVQAAGMADNVYNNMYIWAHRTPDGVLYRFAPWDMDLTWGRMRDEETGEAFDGLFAFGVAQRMIDLDAGGVTVSALRAQWRRMREGAFTREHVEALVTKYQHELNDSGAYMRNSALWMDEARYADGYEIVAFAGQRFETLDALFGAAPADGSEKADE